MFLVWRSIIGCSQNTTSDHSEHRSRGLILGTPPTTRKSVKDDIDLPLPPAPVSDASCVLYCGITKPVGLFCQPGGGCMASSSTSKLGSQNSGIPTMMAISAVKWAGMPDMREDANMQSCAEIAHELQP
jgi:hypothetical protein